MKELLLSAIACPKCHGKLELDSENHQLICTTDRLAYPIKDSIPVLLQSEAKPIAQPKSVQE